MDLHFNIIIDSIALIVVALIYINGLSEVKRDYSQRLFNFMLLALGICLLFDMPAWHTDGKNPAMVAVLQIVLNSLIYIFQAVYCFIWLLYVKYNVVGQRIKNRKIFIYAIPLFLQIVLLIINVFNGTIFFVDSNNAYVRGDYFLYANIVYVVYVAWAVLIAMLGYLNKTDPKQKRSCIFLIMFMVLPICGAIFQILFYGISLVNVSMALSFMMVYLNVQQKRLRSERLLSAQKENELIESRISIMLSQIQPHFLFNVM